LTTSQGYLYRYSKYIKLIFLGWDLVLLNTAFLLSFFLRFGLHTPLPQREAESGFLFSNLIWIGIILYQGEYKFIRVEHIDRVLAKSIKIVFLHVFLMFTIMAILHFVNISRLRMLYFYGVFFSGIFIFRIIFILLLKRLRKAGYNYRNVVIVGAGIPGREIASILGKDLAYGYRVWGHFDDDAKSTDTQPILGKLADIQEYALQNRIHEIYVTNPLYDVNLMKNLTEFCEKNLIRIKFVPDFQKYTQNKKVEINFYDHIPVISLRQEPLETPINRVFKRIFDCIFSISVILVIFPWLFPLMMLLVKLSSKGPIFFKQLRSGEDNKTFYCLKFRTMKVNSLSDELQAKKGDNRITRIGKFLRKTNLDELPQFFNVLLGDMSVVGPRPHMVKHTEEFSELIGNYPVRHYTRPGITGWAQVSGYRGETKNFEQLNNRIIADIWYIENWSLLLDLKIILRTVSNMLRGEANAN
jgi:putative colanic acid biosynthesis UDP-glucose lipid carrier transferase